MSESKYLVFFAGADISSVKHGKKNKKVREIVDLGRVMAALIEYKKSEASIGRVARIGEVSVRAWVLGD